MANEQNYIGVAMGLDVSDLKAGLSEANKQISLANSKFAAASSGMEDWTKSAEGLSAKIEQLDTVLKMQKAKLAGLKAEYEKVAKEQGENSEAARKLQIQINNQQAVVNKTEKEFENYKETLKGVEDGSIDLEESSLKAGKAVKKAGEEAEEAGDGFTIAKGAIAGFIANGLTALVSAAGNAVKSVLGLADSTRELRENMNKIETAFETAGHGAEQAQKTYTDLYKILGDEGTATEAAQQLAKISKTEKDLTTNTKILTGVMAEYGDSIPTEGLAEGIAASSAMSSVQGVLADALEWQGVNLEDYNKKLEEMSSEEERSAYIQKTLLDLYGKSATAYEEKNKSVIAAREAEAELAKTTAELGAITEPVTTSIKQGMTEVLKTIIQLVSDGNMEALKEGIEGAFRTFIDEILPAIVSGLKWMVENFDTIIAGVVGIGAAFLAWKVATIVQGVVKAYKAWTLATQGQTVAQKLLNLAMKANPIGIVISLITGLVAAFSVLWSKSEGFRNFWKGLWDGIKNVASKAKDGIAKIFEGLGNIIKAPFNGVISLINGAIGAINKISVKVPDWVPEFGGRTIGFNIPKIPKLGKGGIVDEATLAMIGEKGKEAVVPLEEETGWIKKIAALLAKDVSTVKRGASDHISNRTNGGKAGGVTHIDARMSVSYNGKLSRKELKKTENNHYKAVKMRLKAEGAI